MELRARQSPQKGLGFRVWDGLPEGPQKGRRVDVERHVLLIDLRTPKIPNR